ncbi:MAG: hypothetical protein GF320_01555 [Armatimonadia bacterium]|nr:hypothetical protein [Armatimonadia bacterium]
MAWYTATRPVTRRLGQSRVICKRGQAVFVEHREEAERLLAEGAVVPGKVRLAPEPSGEEQTPDAAEEDRELIRDLARDAGLTYGGALAKVRRLTGTGSPASPAMEVPEAALRIRGELGLLDEAGELELLAADLRIPDQQANDLVSRLMERDSGLTLRQAIRRAREGLPPAAPVSGEQADPEEALSEGMRVMAVFKGEVQPGTVVSAGASEVRVKLDGDEADYRRIPREDVAPYTEAEAAAEQVAG